MEGLWGPLEKAAVPPQSYTDMVNTGQNPALLKEAPRAAAPTKPAPLERKASSDVIDLSSPPRVRQPFTGAQSAVQTSPLTPRKVALRAAIANKDNHTATQDDRIATQADRAAT